MYDFRATQATGFKTPLGNTVELSHAAWRAQVWDPRPNHRNNHPLRLNIMLQGEEPKEP